MKKYFSLFASMMIVFFACELDLVNHSQVITYCGKTVIETPAPFLINGDGALNRGSNSVGQIENSPPAGTVYGHENDPDNVYLSQGGEQLPKGSWSDQTYQELYSTSLYRNSSITFNELTLVTITSGNSCQYLDNNGIWNTVGNNITIYVKAVRTDEDGSCQVTTNAKGVYNTRGGDGNNEG